MKLSIATPLEIIVDAEDVDYVRAEDATGSFGVKQGHADFLTTLAVSVVSWRAGASSVSGSGERRTAVRGGVFSVRGGDTVTIVTPEAVGEETLDRLGAAVLSRLAAEAEEEEAARLLGARMEFAALRQIDRVLNARRVASAPGALGQGYGPGSDEAAS